MIVRRKIIGRKGKSYVEIYGKDRAEEELSKRLKSLCCYPNKPEKFLIGLLDEILPGEYKYVGDGSVLVGYKSPDFINVNG